MKLTASLVIHNELDRYLLPCVESLMEFCDEVAIWDDGSDDGTEQALQALYLRDDRLRFHRDEERTFFDHEGRLRQRALEWALESGPTHVLAIDADELILEGEKVRNQLARGDVWSLCMREVWKVRQAGVEIRQDGGWCEHPVSILWKVPRLMGSRWRIADVALASGRTPMPVATVRPRFTDVAVYHFGWANQGDRWERYQRYVQHDGGRFHRNSHIKSIMWPDVDITATFEQVAVPRAWVDRANRAVQRSPSMEGSHTHARKSHPF